MNYDIDDLIFADEEVMSFFNVDELPTDLRPVFSPDKSDFVLE